MSHLEVIEAVRLQAVAAFRQFRLADDGEPRESILLTGGIYCGRRFEVERGYAVWNAENDDLKVFRAGGKLLIAISQASSAQVSTRAAA